MGTGHCPQSPGRVLQSPTQIGFQRGGGGAGKGEGLVSPLLILNPGAGGTGPGPSPPASQWILPGAQLLPLQAAPGEGHVPCPAVVRSEPGSAWHHPGPRLCTRHQQRGPPLATRGRGLQPDSPEPTAPPRGARARADRPQATLVLCLPSQTGTHSCAPPPRKPEHVRAQNGHQQIQIPARGGRAFRGEALLAPATAKRLGPGVLPGSRAPAPSGPRARARPVRPRPRRVSR